jgi:hypothetical protein
MAPDAWELLMDQNDPNVAQMDAVGRLGVCIKRNELLLEENEKLKALLREVIDDTPMYRIDRMTREKIEAALK